MDSAINKSRENVDINDSNINRTLYEVEANVIKCNGRIKPPVSLAPIVFPRPHPLRVTAERPSPYHQTAGGGGL
ncbi:hypothetical protein CEXT_710921 [Caerostris extrusa]|uniref:Uncharacterized protein n=1 Tax=Caerostris extrusa TaxID=172846 RepID=A0AAV4TP15_CAEEX|nr:hypothetical protein CEXT_710921 [Caerostris extrusa]